MRLEDYFDADPKAQDRFYARQAAVIDGYEFDRVALQASPAARSARPTSRTGSPSTSPPWRSPTPASRWPKACRGSAPACIVGNTPHRRVLPGQPAAAALAVRAPHGRRGARRRRTGTTTSWRTLPGRLRGRRTRAPFPEIDEDTLAGGAVQHHRRPHLQPLRPQGRRLHRRRRLLLLAVVRRRPPARRSSTATLDVAVAGGVDLSHRPVRDHRLRQDRRAGHRRDAGLRPRLQRLLARRGLRHGRADARARTRARPATASTPSIAGWGISSDGKGGITRPEASGYQLALRRAYERAGFGIETVGHFRGARHRHRRSATPPSSRPCPSAPRGAADPARAAGRDRLDQGQHRPHQGGGRRRRADQGHARRAPRRSCRRPSAAIDPHELLASERRRCASCARPSRGRPSEPVRAGVTAMGFGGINTHVVLESAAPRRRRAPFDSRDQGAGRLAAGRRAAAGRRRAPRGLRRAARAAGRLRARRCPTPSWPTSPSTLHRELRGPAVPGRGRRLVTRGRRGSELRRSAPALDAGRDQRMFDADGRRFLGARQRAAAGSASCSPARAPAAAPAAGRCAAGSPRPRRSTCDAALPTAGDVVAPRSPSRASSPARWPACGCCPRWASRRPSRSGTASARLTALHWAGRHATRRRCCAIAALRGRTMARAQRVRHDGQASRARPEASTPLVADAAGGHRRLQRPRTDGRRRPGDAVAAGRRAGARRRAVPRDPAARLARLPLPAGGARRRRVRRRAGRGGVRPGRPADRLDRHRRRRCAADTDVAALLHRQITAPVLFTQAIDAGGQGRRPVHRGRSRPRPERARGVATDVPAVALDTDDESLAGLLRVVGRGVHRRRGRGGQRRCSTAGSSARWRSAREFRFFASPCEQAPRPGGRRAHAQAGARVGRSRRRSRPPRGEPDAATGPADLLRRLAAERAELPVELVHAGQPAPGRSAPELDHRGSGGQPGRAGSGPAGPQLPTNFATATIE